VLDLALTDGVMLVGFSANAGTISTRDKQANTIMLVNNFFKRKPPQE